MNIFEIRRSAPKGNKIETQFLEISSLGVAIDSEMTSIRRQFLIFNHAPSARIII